MRTIRIRYSLVWLFLIAGLLNSCSPKSTPPGANSIGGSVDGASYSYHYWEEGLAILIWHDFSNAAESCTGTGSTEDPVYRLECGVQAQDGRRFEWEVHTRDGVTAEMWIDGHSFDLSQGTMFLISSQDDGVKVDQLPRDFSQLEPDNETISAMANSDRDVASFIDSIEPVSDSPDSDTNDGVDESTAEPTQPDAGLLATLPEALTNADYATLEQMMGDSFNIGYWRSEGQTLTPSEAIEQLQLNLLPDPTTVTFTVDPSLFPDLGEFDPKAAFGPDVQIVDLVYSQGWGIDGQDEVILAIGLHADGSQYWHGIIYGIAGFAETAGQPPPNPALSFQAATYRNEENGFEFDYPASWSFEEGVLGDRASGAQFLSEGEFVMSAVVYLWDPKNDLDAYVDRWRQGWSASGVSVLSEAELMLAGGRRAIQFEFEEADGSTRFVMFTEAGDRYLELSGAGDLNLLTEIAQTLRPLGSTTPVSESESDQLVQPADFTYLGAFRLPDRGERPLTFAYGGSAMTFNPNGDPAGEDDGFPGSLFIVGHPRLAYGELPNGSQVAEVQIPTPIVADNVADLSQAQFIQDFSDVAAGCFTGMDEIPRIGIEYLETSAI